LHHGMKDLTIFHLFAVFATCMIGEIKFHLYKFSDI
jgi:hypothetical protein